MTRAKRRTRETSGEMVRLRNMLEDEFRSRLNEAEGRVKADVFQGAASTACAFSSSSFSFSSLTRRGGQQQLLGGP